MRRDDSTSHIEPPNDTTFKFPCSSQHNPPTLIATSECSEAAQSPLLRQLTDTANVQPIKGPHACTSTVVKSCLLYSKMCCSTIGMSRSPFDIHPVLQFSRDTVAVKSAWNETKQSLTFHVCPALRISSGHGW